MSNSTRALLVGLCLAGSGVGLPIVARAGTDINIAPPAPRVEVVPGPLGALVIGAPSTGGAPSRVGLISDTHGQLRPEALAFFAGCTPLIHGGDIGDPEILERLAATAPLVTEMALCTSIQAAPGAGVSSCPCRWGSC